MESVKKSSPVKSPSNKSRIPQRIEQHKNGIKTPVSPTSGKFQSKIPRSTSLKYSSPVKDSPRVRRQVSEPSGAKVQNPRTLEKSKVLREYVTPNGKLKRVGDVTPGKIVGYRKLNRSSSDGSYQQPQKLANGYNNVSNKKSDSNIHEYSKSTIIATSSITKEIPYESNPSETHNDSLNNWSLNATNCLNKATPETSKKIEVQPICEEIPEKLLLNNVVKATATSKHNSSTVEDNSDSKDLEGNNNHSTYSFTMENEVHTPKKPVRSSIPGEQKLKDGSPNLNSDIPNEDFERTEHDNDDYSTVTTTEYEKDGKMVRTTETINYTNDKNIKTRVTTTEKIITIPYGQQLDLNSPEITSSTTVRSKYLQTMLQSREFAGDKEINAEKVETIETDVQTEKTDSNDNTDDPDLETVLVIVETLDELRTTEPKIKHFTGTSTTDQTYTELSEILNKSMSKFEKIEPKGKVSVEQKRQNGIDYIKRLIEQLNSKLEENQKTEAENIAKTVPTKPTSETENKPELKPEPVQKVENATVGNAPKLPVTEPEPEANSKKGRKVSTLKKHFKLGAKDKKNGDIQEKKKKKKLCVIS